MPSITVECPIHLGNVPLSDVRTLKCGHGFCTECLSRMHTTSRIVTVFCPVCRKRGKFTDARPIYMDAGRGSSPPIPLSPSPSHSPQPQSHSETNAVGDRERTRFQAEINRLNTHLRESQDDSSALRAALEAAHVEHEQLMGDVDTLRGRLDMLERRAATQIRALEANVAVLRHDAAQVGPLEEDAAMARAEVMRLKEVKECLMREVKEVREREGCWRGWVEEHKKETMKWKGKVKGMKEQLKRIERERENERNRVKVGAEEEIEEESLVVLDAHEGGLDPIKKVHKAKGKDNEDWLDELWLDGDANEFAPIDVDENSLTEDESVVEMDTGDVARPPYFVSARALLKTGSLDEDRPLPQDRPRSFVRFPSDWTLSNTDGKGKVFDGVASGSGVGGGTSVALSNNAAKKRKREDWGMGRDPILMSTSGSNSGSTFVKFKLNDGKGKGRETRMSPTSRHNGTKAVTRSRSSTGAKATTATSTSLKSTGETSSKPAQGARANRPPFPIALDNRGRVKGLVSYGTRQPMFGAMKY